MVAMYFLFWSYTWDYASYICRVGLFTRMSLSGLHSCVDSLRLVTFRGGGWICYPWFVCCLGMWYKFGWFLCLRDTWWYCVMSRRLWSSSMLSGCTRSSSVRHCCVGPLKVFHWHRYVILMVNAPHLSFMVLTFSLIMECIVCPGMGCGEGFGFGSGVCGYLLWPWWVVLVGCGCWWRGGIVSELGVVPLWWF